MKTIFTYIALLFVGGIFFACQKNTLPEPVACARLNKDSIAMLDTLMVTNCSRAENAIAYFPLRGESINGQKPYYFNENNIILHRFDNPGDYDVVIRADNANDKDQATDFFRTPVNVAVISLE